MFLAGLLQRPGEESGGHFPRLLHNVLLANMQNIPKGLNVGNAAHPATHPPPKNIVIFICYGVIDPE